MYVWKISDIFMQINIIGYICNQNSRIIKGCKSFSSNATTQINLAKIAQ